MGFLESKVAVVTGAGSGIGKEIARVLVREGATTLCVDISGHEVETAEELGPLASASRVDVSVASDIEQCLHAFRDEHGKLDILCNNAGIHGPGVALGLYPETDYDDVFRINTKGVFLGLRTALPIMGAQGYGSIVNTASIGGFRSSALTIPYSASKAAVIALTQGAALEYGPAGVRINAVCPGSINTPMSDAVPAGVKDLIADNIPLRRKGEPSEIAEAVAFLASDRASFISGTSLVIDGGYTVRIPNQMGQDFWSQEGWASLQVSN
jgi:NAD(P)-dependent dehydrogenase (short-subunit alcohol dehydrogenase family)